MQHTRCWAGHDREDGLVRIDNTAKTVNSIIVVVGSGAGNFLRYVHEKTGSADRDRAGTSAGDEASMMYLPLQLGDIRGYRTWFHLYGFGTDERLGRMMEDTVQHANGIIVVLSQPGADDKLVRAAAYRLANARRAVPAAVLGPFGIDREWARATGANAAFAALASEDSVFPALRAVCKEILAALSRNG